MSRIPFSQKHGVNPTIPLCFFCGEQKNEVALLGKLPDDAEAPRNCVVDMEPCDICEDRRKTHVHLIVVKNGQDNTVEEQRQRWLDHLSRLPLRKHYPFMPQLARAVHTYWIDRDQVANFVNPSSLSDQILRAGWKFIPEEVEEKLGLSRLREAAAKEHPDAKEIVCRGAKFVVDDEGYQDEKG